MRMRMRGCVCGGGGARTCKLRPPVRKWPRREPVEWSRDVSACRLYGHGSRSVASFWHTSWMWEICVAVMNATDEAPQGDRASMAAKSQRRRHMSGVSASPLSTAVVRYGRYG